MEESLWESLSCHSEHILDVIKNHFKFSSMTPVQHATIPIFIKNKDVCVEAVTGSGKTLAFVVPLLVHLLVKKHENLKASDICALVLTPTRELAFQIYDVLKQFLHPEKCPFTASLFIGGHGDMANDLKTYQEKGSNIIIGTPGRVCSALENFVEMRNGIKSLEVLVLDEADRLLDLGFHKSITTIFAYLPKQRRTGLFSATLTDEVSQLVKAGLRDPVKIIVREKALTETFAACEGVKTAVRTPSSLCNQYIVCPDSSHKFNTLMSFITNHRNNKLLIFFSTCASVEYFGKAIKTLLGVGWDVLMLHGKLKKKRINTFKKFREMKQGILICTDVVARGVDIPEVDWVLQFDPPSNASSFVHRCGRTARIGNKGNALLFLLECETTYVDFIEINQRAPMMEYQFDNIDETWLSKLQSLSLVDRSFMERATKAYVSYVQAYGKHECKLIFRLKYLDLGDLATGFALLRLPRMPELKNKEITNFEPVDIEFDKIPYKDTIRETQRLSELGSKLDKRDHKKLFVSRKQKAWSNKKEHTNLKKVKREKRAAAKKRKQEKITFNDEELKELEDDARMVKRLKNKKISQSEYDDAVLKDEKELEPFLEDLSKSALPSK